MNAGVILAGGVGNRMGASIPKQFIEVKGKPIIAYTIDLYQNNPDIDIIEVVCHEGYEDTVRSYVDKYGFTKIKTVVTGGITAQDSIYNGILGLADILKPDDLIQFHMSVSPMIDDDIISDGIRVCRDKGNGMSAQPELIYPFIKADDISTDQYVPIRSVMLLNMPWTFHYGEISTLYEEAYKTGVGIGDNTYAVTLMIDNRKKLYFSKGSTKNIKITTPDDLKLFEAYLSIK